MKPKELWDEFEAAYYACPQSQREFDDDAHELGVSKPYGKMKKKYEDVIGYWMDSTTIGGRMLLSNGYLEAVNPDIYEMCENYMEKVKQAQKKIAKEVFG
jgi:hypothetical protein